MKKVVWLLVLIIGLMSIPVHAADYDFGGETVYIGQSVWFYHYFNFMNRDSFDDPRFEQYWQEVEERFNVNLEWLQVSDCYPASAAIDLVLPRVIAGEGNFIFVTGDAAIPILVANNLVLPVTEWINDEYFERLPSPFKSLPYFVNFLGENWAFQFGPRMMTEADGVFWNMELFEELGLPNLQELYEAGEWTYDAMKEIALQITADTDGDGETDRFGVSARWGYEDWALMTRWIWTNGGELAREVDGRVVFALDSDEAIEALDFYRELIELGVFTNEMYYFAMAEGRVGMHIDFADNLSYMGEVDTTFGFVPLPKGPRVDEHVAVEGRKWVALLPITATNPEALIELWHALFELAEPYIEDMERWEDDYYYNIALLLKDEKSLENMIWVHENTQPAKLIDVFGQVPGFYETIIDIMHGEKEAKVAVAEIKPAVQAYLDEMFDQ